MGPSRHSLWKAPTSDDAALTSASSGSLCGKPFSKNQQDEAHNCPSSQRAGNEDPSTRRKWIDARTKWLLHISPCDESQHQTSASKNAIHKELGGKIHRIRANAISAGAISTRCSLSTRGQQKHPWTEAKQLWSHYDQKAKRDRRQTLVLKHKAMEMEYFCHNEQLQIRSSLSRGQTEAYYEERFYQQ